MYNKTYKILGFFLVCIFFLTVCVQASATKSAPSGILGFFSKLWDNTIGKLYTSVILPVIDAVIGPNGILNGKAPDPATYQVVKPGQVVIDPNTKLPVTVTDPKTGFTKLLTNEGNAPAVVVKVERGPDGLVKNAQLWGTNTPGGQQAFQNMLANAQSRQQGIIFYQGGGYEKMVPREFTPAGAVMAGVSTAYLPTGTGMLASLVYDAIFGERIPQPDVSNPFDVSTLGTWFPNGEVSFPDGQGGESRISLTESDARTFLARDGAHIFVPEGSVSGSMTFNDVQLPGQLMAGSTTYYVTAGPPDASGNTQFFVNSYRNEPMEFYNYVSPIGYSPSPPCSFSCGNGIKECSERCELDTTTLSWANNSDCAQDNAPICSGVGNHLSQLRDAFGDCSPLLECQCQLDEYSAPTCNPSVCGAQCTPSENTLNSNPKCTGVNAGQICGNNCMCGSLCGNGNLDAGEQCEVASDCKLPNGAIDDSKKCNGCICVDKTKCGDEIVQTPNDYGQTEECEPKNITVNIISQILGDGTISYKIEQQPLFYLYSVKSYSVPIGPQGQCTVGCLSCTNGCTLNHSFKSVGPGPSELCDGWDNNCDGHVDEGCKCNAGESRSCGASPGMLQNIGACQNGSMTCLPDLNAAGETVGGHWGECMGGKWPRLEIANGIDDNCDGHVDECVIVDLNVPVVPAVSNKLVHRGIYFANMSVVFYTGDLIIGGLPAGVVPSPVWKILEEPSFLSTAETFEYNFTSSGQKTITLTLMSAGKVVDEYQIAILIIDNSANMFTFINRPFHKQIVSINTRNNPAHVVNYSAEESYVVSVSASADPCLPYITCLAGNCPSKSIVPVLPSCNDLISVSGGNQGFAKFNFDWKFADLSGADVSGLGKASGSVNYYSTGDKVINLLLNYEPSGANIKRQFTREFSVIYNNCSVDGSTFYKFDASGRVKERLDTINTLGACKGNDNLEGTYDDCCPSGYICGNSQTDAPGTQPHCIYSDKTSCSEFNADQQTCEITGTNIVTVNRGGIVLEPLNQGLPHHCGDSYTLGTCNYITECSCSWDSAASKCNFKTKRTSTDLTHFECTSGECVYSAENLGECKSGFKNADIKATVISGLDPDCVTKTTSIPCGRSLLALPFFGLLQFFTALLLIVVIYFAFRKKIFGKKKNRRK